MHATIVPNRAPLKSKSLKNFTTTRVVEHTHHLVVEKKKVSEISCSAVTNVKINPTMTGFKFGL